MNKWFVSVVIMSSLLLGTLMMSSPDKTEAAVRQNVVKLFSEDGSCSGVRIKYKKSFLYLLRGIVVHFSPAALSWLVAPMAELKV